MLRVDRTRLHCWTARVAKQWSMEVPLAHALCHPEITNDQELCLATHLACFTFDGGHLFGASDRACELAATSIQKEISRLERLYQPSNYVEPSRVLVEETFREFADIRGIKILRVLQEGTYDAASNRWVFLGIDTDGIAKVWKEIDERTFDSERWRQSLPTEDILFERIKETSGCVSVYGVESLSEVRFLRRAFVYGQSLLDFVRDGKSLRQCEARQFIGELAGALAGLHQRGVITGDLRPQNVFVDTAGHPILFDLGNGFLLGDDPLADHDAFVTDPRYLAPEMVWQHRMGRHTEVFQLGMIYHQLVYGCEAFGVSAVPEDRTSYERLTLRYGLPSALCDYEGTDPLIKRMLDPEPALRPTMQEVAEELKPLNRVFILHPPRNDKPCKQMRDTVLVPARIGLPHRGHIDLIARAIDLGYRALISLQKAYTISQDDPYPKWDIMKMVARSLMKLGYVPEQDFVFTFTRFFETDREHEMHFAMMPESERIAAIVSGNPDVQHLLSRPVLDQQVLFGTEGESFQARSWGERLRRSVHENDQATFANLVACGVEDVRTFEELCVSYAKTPVEFVPVYEQFHLEDHRGQMLARGTIRRYGRLDEQLISVLKSQDPSACLLDPFASETRVRISGEEGVLRFQDGQLQPNGKLLVKIQFIVDSSERSK